MRDNLYSKTKILLVSGRNFLGFKSGPWADAASMVADELCVVTHQRTHGKLAAKHPLPDSDGYDVLVTNWPAVGKELTFIKRVRAAEQARGGASKPIVLVMDLSDKSGLPPKLAQRILDLAQGELRFAIFDTNDLPDHPAGLITALEQAAKYVGLYPFNPLRRHNEQLSSLVRLHS